MADLFISARNLLFDALTVASFLRHFSVPPRRMFGSQEERVTFGAGEVGYELRNVAGTCVINQGRHFKTIHLRRKHREREGENPRRIYMENMTNTKLIVCIRLRGKT